MEAAHKKEGRVPWQLAIMEPFGACSQNFLTFIQNHDKLAHYIVTYTYGSAEVFGFNYIKLCSND